MVLICFQDDSAKRRALGFLPGRFAFKSWASGEMLVPEPALAELAMEGISFIVQGPPRYDQQIPAIRNPPAAAV